jgi:hypothetical protein
MKANELRIGNYVYDNLGGVLKIKGISLDSTLSHIKPIPLTEEWLFKFGFKMNMDNFDWNAGLGVNCIGDFELSLRYTDNIGWFYRSKCTPIKYVHQLQNLYFAITGDELTIGGQDE